MYHCMYINMYIFELCVSICVYDKSVTRNMLI